MAAAGSSGMVQLDSFLDDDLLGPGDLAMFASSGGGAGAGAGAGAGGGPSSSGGLGGSLLPGGTPPGPFSSSRAGGFDGVLAGFADGLDSDLFDKQLLGAAASRPPPKTQLTRVAFSTGDLQGLQALQHHSSGGPGSPYSGGGLDPRLVRGGRGGRSIGISDLCPRPRPL